MQGADIGLQLLANIPAFYYGTSPNKFFDYLACGLPVLVNYPGWVADLLDSYDAGYVVKSCSTEEAHKILTQVAANKSELMNKGLNARALAEKEFDRDKLFEIWFSKLKTVDRGAKTEASL